MPIVTIQTTAKNGEIITTTYVLENAAEAEQVHSLLRTMGKDGHSAHISIRPGGGSPSAAVSKTGWKGGCT